MIVKKGDKKMKKETKGVARRLMLLIFILGSVGLLSATINPNLAGTIIMIIIITISGMCYMFISEEL